MEFLEGGTLSQTALRHDFIENEISYVAKQILTAVQYLHENQLVHRDIKSHNVMITIKGIIKLIDMGVMADLSLVPNRTEMLGSPHWIPPEMIRSQSHDYKSDIWSYAICLTELANRHPPYVKSPCKAMLTAVTHGYQQPFDHKDKWSDIFLDFLQHCFVQDPLQRSSAHELLKHPFIELSETITRKQMKEILTSAFQDTMKMFNL